MHAHRDMSHFGCSGDCQAMIASADLDSAVLPDVKVKRVILIPASTGQAIVEPVPAGKPKSTFEFYSWVRKTKLLDLAACQSFLG